MPSRRWIRGVGLAGAIAVGSMLGACSSSEPAPKAADSTATAPPKTTVAVTMKEFTLAPALASVPAGSVTFAVQNAGLIPHEFVVVKSDLAPDKLPQIEQKLVDEKQIQVISKTAQFDGAKRQDVTASLTPGRYVLLCNVPSHYISGMYVAFAVTSGGAPTSATPMSGANPSSDRPGY